MLTSARISTVLVEAQAVALGVLGAAVESLGASLGGLDSA
jgi:hypothetical protein